MGGLGFWKSSKRVIKSEFYRLICAKSIRSSGHYTNFVVQSFDCATRYLSLCSEPIQDEVLMSAKHAGNFHHRLQAAAHGAQAPVVEKGLRPQNGFVLPKMVEGFLQLSGSSRG